MPRFGRVAASGKADGSVVTAADLAAQERVRAALARRIRTSRCLAEEMPASEQEALLRQSRGGHGASIRSTAPATSPRVSRSLRCRLAWIDGGRVELGLIYDPVRRELFTARRGRRGRLNGEPLLLGRDAATLGACDRARRFQAPSRQPRRPGWRRRHPFRSQAQLGSDRARLVLARRGSRRPSTRTAASACGTTPVAPWCSRRRAGCRACSTAGTASAGRTDAAQAHRRGRRQSGAAGRVAGLAAGRRLTRPIPCTARGKDRRGRC